MQNGDCKVQNQSFIILHFPIYILISALSESPAASSGTIEEELDIYQQELNFL